MSENGNKRTLETKNKILELLKEHEKMHTKEIAKNIGMAPATAAKYVAILEGEKRVKMNDEQPPYKYWSLNDGSNE